ncbi:MAG: pyridoxamine 5'-phosphate oxidase family protein [Chloroflexota bacterium]
MSEKNEPNRIEPALVKAVQRFSQSDCSWLSTIRPDGRTHLSPMWHVWHRGRIYLVTPATSVKVANLKKNPSVSIAHPDPSDVIIIEGQAVIADGMTETLKPLFQEKYQWDISTDRDYNTIVEITPLRMMAWNNSPVQRWGRAELSHFYE